MTNRSTRTSAWCSTLPLLFVWDPRLHSVISGCLSVPPSLPACLFLAKWATLSPTHIICAQHGTRNLSKPKVSKMTVISVRRLGRYFLTCVCLMSKLLLHLCCCWKVFLLFCCSSICDFSHQLHFREWVFFIYLSSEGCSLLRGLISQPDLGLLAAQGQRADFVICDWFKSKAASVLKCVRTAQINHSEDDQ